MEETRRLKNKKLYYLAAISIACGLAATGFNGRTQMSTKERNNYLVNIDPNMEGKKDAITQTALSELHVVFFSKTSDAFITLKEEDSYYDYFSGTKIKDFDIIRNNAIVIDYDIDLFLIKYNFLKDEYSNGDLMNLLTMIKSDYQVGKDDMGYTLSLKKEEK